MGAALPLVDHHEASELRALARRAKKGRVASRMAAIADALDDMTRVKALSGEEWHPLGRHLGPSADRRSLV